jgi:hypothetical protein
MISFIMSTFIGWNRTHFSFLTISDWGIREWRYWSLHYKRKAKYPEDNFILIGDFSGLPTTPLELVDADLLALETYLWWSNVSQHLIWRC